MGSKNILERLDFFQTQSVSDASAQGRIEAIYAGLRVFFENPIFGAGTGITNVQSNIWPYQLNVHNQMIMIAAEHGIFGIALWAWLLVILWRGHYFQDTKFQVAAAVGTLFMSSFNHNMFDNLIWLMTFALVSGRRQRLA
jgi:O-antigen ligase